MTKSPFYQTIQMLLQLYLIYYQEKIKILQAQSLGERQLPILIFQKNIMKCLTQI